MRDESQVYVVILEQEYKNNFQQDTIYQHHFTHDIFIYIFTLSLFIINILKLDLIYTSQIDKYNALYAEVSALPSQYLCNGWLKLELKRLNQAIMNIICKWSNLYKQNLKDHVQTRYMEFYRYISFIFIINTTYNVLRFTYLFFSLNDLEQFIAYASKELSVELEDDDYEGLLKVMGVLNEVKAKMDAGTDQMFEPLRDIIYVLKEYGVEFPEETYEQVM